MIVLKFVTYQFGIKGAEGELASGKDAGALLSRGEVIPGLNPRDFMKLVI